MSFAASYVDRFTARHFNEDEHGRTHYLPMGRFTSGRLLPDAVVAERVRRTVWVSYLVLVVAIAPVAFSLVFFFHRMSWRGLMVIGALSVVSGLSCGGWLQVLARGFPKSDGSSILRDGPLSPAKTMGGSGLALSMTISMALGVASIVLVLAQPAATSRALALLSVALFGACAISCWLRLRALDTDANSRPD